MTFPEGSTDVRATLARHPLLGWVVTLRIRRLTGRRPWPILHERWSLTRRAATAYALSWQPVAVTYATRTPVTFRRAVDDYLHGR